MLHRPNKTAGAKRGLIETSAYDALLPYVAGPNEPPRYALHFGTVDKVGVNPRSQWDTPLAVCAYPLTKEIFKQFLRISLPFAQKEAKYLYLLEIRPEARVFYSTNQFFNQGVGPEYVGTARESRDFFYSTRPKGYLNLDQYISEKHRTVARAAQWGLKLSKMGIDVWVDADREGILHESEPSQTMFFSPRSYSVVLSMDNPKNKQTARYGRDWRRREDVRGADMKGENLRGANLKNVTLIDADLREAVLIDADLTKAVLTGAILTDAKLWGAILTGADLTGAYLKYANYDESTVWPDSVRDVLRVWQGDKDLRGAGLTRADLTHADLSYADLTGADLTGADLTRARLNVAILTDAILTDADLPQADLTRADLTGADLTRADLTGAYLRDVKYGDSTVWPDSVRDVLRVWRGDKDLTRADLTRANLTRADLRGVVLTEANLQSVVLIGSDLRGANLTGSDLRNAVIYKSDLRGADLRGVLLDDENLNDIADEYVSVASQFTSITYDKNTKWPEGFIPPPSTPRPNRR
jgi:uncharacterized protein YjbI with pentapeptide repeats